MFQRILTILIGAPIALLLIAIAVINRQNATLVLDPFKPQDPALALTMPFYFFLFGTLFLGIIAGGFAVWLSQGQYRSSARTRAQEARRWRAEADRLARERDARIESSSDSREVALIGR